jgi:hypothetical protein
MPQLPTKQTTALLLGLLSVAMVAFTSPISQPVTGTLIDLSCYSENKSNTDNHHMNRGMTCAQACAREGFEVALLTHDGTVYHLRGSLIAHKNAKLISRMSQTVTITGIISKVNGQNLLASESLTEFSRE